MRIPEKLLCDICGGEIKNHNHAIKISIPMTEELRQPIVDALEKSTPPGFLRIVPVSHTVAHHWTLETCGCVLSMLPMLAELVAKDIQRTLQAREKQAAGATVTSMEDL